MIIKSLGSIAEAFRSYQPRQYGFIEKSHKLDIKTDEIDHNEDKEIKSVSGKQEPIQEIYSETIQEESQDEQIPEEDGKKSSQSSGGPQGHGSDSAPMKEVD